MIVPIAWRVVGCAYAARGRRPFRQSATQHFKQSAGLEQDTCDKLPRCLLGFLQSKYIEVRSGKMILLKKARVTCLSLPIARYIPARGFYACWRDRSIRDGNGRTALHFAATGGGIGVIGAILEMAPGVIDSKVTMIDLQQVPSPKTCAVKHHEWESKKEETFGLGDGQSNVPFCPFTCSGPCAL